MSRFYARRAGLAALALWLAACSGGGEGGAADGPVCRIEQRGVVLDPALAETSGVAGSARTPGLLWSHNDSGDEPSLYALDASGALLGRVRVTGASNTDWEDVAVGPCPAGNCVYIADTGDNEEKRGDAAVYRVPEPSPDAAETAPAERFPVRFPGGPRDTEAIFVLPSGDLFLVTKGRTHAPTIFRYPAPLRAGQAVVLEQVGTLGSEALTLIQQVTGADATPDGEFVALRTYGAVSIYPTGALLAGDPTASVLFDVTPLWEAQGEGVAIDADGRVVLTSEAVRESPATLSVLSCDLP